jgi:hypothetical protein
MSEILGSRSEFGDGPLSRACAASYTLLAVELLLLAGVAPGLALLTLLTPEAANLPLFALAAVPVGPALSAALVTLRGPRDLVDLHPGGRFYRAYRRNAVAVLRLWGPALAVLTIIAINLAHLDVAGVPPVWAGLLVASAVITGLWALNAVTICSFFTFRTRDVAWLAWYLLARLPSVTLGLAGLLGLALAVTGFWSEVALALLGSGFAGLLLSTGRPLISLVEREFTG